MIHNDFMTKTNHIYPPYNNMIFEEYFYNYYVNNNIETDREYLPIFWTNFYISRNYGSSDMNDIQNFLDGLDKTKKYFTIIQYDDGILQNIDNLDIYVFGQGGGGAKTVNKRNIGDYCIPLICQPDPNRNDNRDKSIFASFVGALRGRHSVRDMMLSSLSGKDNIILSDNKTYDYFKNIMECSTFSLCPRGYGATSFRICESLQHGSIPVYIYNDPWIPWKDEFDFNDIGIMIGKNDITNIYEILKSKTTDDIKKFQDNGKIIYNEYFSYDGCSKNIIKKINII